MYEVLSENSSAQYTSQRLDTSDKGEWTASLVACSYYVLQLCSLQKGFPVGLFSGYAGKKLQIPKMENKYLIAVRHPVAWISLDKTIHDPLEGATFKRCIIRKNWDLTV